MSLADSGCTEHITRDQHDFHNFKPVSYNVIRAARGNSIPVNAIGKLDIIFNTDNEAVSVSLYNVIEVPDVRYDSLPLNTRDYSECGSVEENGGMSLRWTTCYIFPFRVGCTGRWSTKQSRKLN